MAGGKCCEGQQYFNRKQACCNGQVINKLKYSCCNDQITELAPGNFCCGDKTYPTADKTKRCCGGKTIFNPVEDGCCGDQVFSRITHYCCGCTLFYCSVHGQMIPSAVPCFRGKIHHLTKNFVQLNFYQNQIQKLNAVAKVQKDRVTNRVDERRAVLVSYFQ